MHLSPFGKFLEYIFYLQKHCKVIYVTYCGKTGNWVNASIDLFWPRQKTLAWQNSIAIGAFLEKRAWFHNPQLCDQKRYTFAYKQQSEQKSWWNGKNNKHQRVYGSHSQKKDKNGISKVLSLIQNLDCWLTQA